MPMQRLAEQVQWSEVDAKKPSASWGCWECGFEDSYVRDTDKDTEHIRVRRRQCTRCGAMWETEERRIAPGSFFGRAEKRRYARFRKSRYVIRTCLMCKERYQASKYVEHTQSSDAHKAVVERRVERKKERMRAYNRQWMAAKRALAREQAA